MAVLLLLLPLAGGPAADAHGIVGNSLASIARTAEAAARDAAVGPASRVLMAERNCAACHADLAAAGRIEGPDLALASERLQRGWLEAFLADPLGVHPEGRMPDPWRGQTAEKRAENGEALAEFLAATRRALTPLEAGDARAGGRVFHEVGFFACHGAREESELRDAPVAPERAVSLDGLGAKYTGWGLADFLLRPLTHRPGGLMPDLHLSREEAADVAAYLLEGSDAPWESEPVEARPELVVKGRLLWESAGCASCHGLDGPAQARDVGAARGDLSGGCLASAPASNGFAGGAPDFGLDDAQREALRAAAASLDAELTAGDRLAITLTERRCTACHAREGVGARDARLDGWFTTEIPDLGDPARFPPPLDGVGGKLTEPWLERVLAEGAGVRPYMGVRMPRFGWEHLEHLPALLAAEDARPERVYEKPSGERQRELRDAGRELLGIKGLACVSCHTWNGLEAIAFQGPDLIGTYDRLQPAWFHDFLLDPSGFRPGIVMPESWADGIAAHQGILDGDTEAQIEALWHVLSLGTSAPQPEGLSRPNWDLEVGDMPRLYRGRSRVAGFRGIAVGSPMGLHYAFDAHNGALAALWRGRFVSVNWNGQGAGDFNPRERTEDLARDTAFVRLGSPNEAWPLMPLRTKEVRVNPDPTYPWQHGYRFQGYRFDEGRVPTLRYEVDGAAVEDRSIIATVDGRTALERKLTLTAEAPVQLHFRLLTGPFQVEPSGRLRRGRLALTPPAGFATFGRRFTRPTEEGEVGDQEMLMILDLPVGTTSFTLLYELID